jgi:hypothetical protein
MQNMLEYVMRLRLHVSVLVPLSDPRAKAKASERQGKARHLLHRVSEIDVAPRGDQLLHRVRFPVLRRDEDRRFSTLREKTRGVGWGGGGGERVRCTHTHTHTHTNTHTQTHT